MKKGNSSLISNLSWKFAERLTAQLVTLVVSIILARLLDPSHYGTISIVMIFIAIANVFVSGSFGTALIQKKDSDSLDYFSVLYFNIVFSIVLYIILFFTAPMISMFYGEEYDMLVPVLRVLGLRLILSAVNSVQHAYVSKHMIFRKFFLATLLGTIISAVVGITMAYNNCGVWALVAQYLTNSTVDTIVLTISLRKKPRLIFSWKRLKALLPFGSKILASNLLIQGYQELRALIIGKVYSSEDLAYYDKGKQFPSMIVTNINTSISAVLFPKMSNQQDDLEQVKLTAKRSIRFGSYIMCPMMLGMAAVAKPLILVLLTEKWLPCVPLLQLLCINSLCLPLHTANIEAIKAVGRGDITFRIEIIKKSIELAVLLSVMKISVTAIVVGMAACSISFIFLNAWPNRKLIGYPIGEQVKDILPGLGLSLIMATAVYFIGFLSIPYWAMLTIQVVCGITLYILGSVLTRNPEYKFIQNFISRKLNLLKHGKDA